MKTGLMVAGAFVGLVSASAAMAFPIGTTSGFDPSYVQNARTVCDEYGHCFERRTDVGRDIARGVLNGIEGRSAYRDRDYGRRDFYRDDYRPGPRYYHDY